MIGTDAAPTALIEALSLAVRKRRAAPAAQGELEVRLGRWLAGASFQPGVSKDVFDDLEGEMCKQFVTDDKWHEVVDYHYRCPDGRTVRTRVEFDLAIMAVRRTHIQKDEQASITFARTCGGDACRVVCNVEMPTIEVPQCCHPHHVRVKQRKCFRDVRMGHVVWRYELSRTWCGPDAASAERMKKVSPPTYEVECELVDEDGHYMDKYDDEHIGLSLLLKGKILMGDEEDAHVHLVTPACAKRRPVRHTPKAKRPRASE